MPFPWPPPPRAPPAEPDRPEALRLAPPEDFGRDGFRESLIGRTLYPGNDRSPLAGAPVTMSGGDLLSHPVARAVPSALEGLTSGFGMGPGVPPPPWPPKRCEGASLRTDPELDSEREQSQVLGLLVPVG